MKKEGEKLSMSEALLKAAHFCAYQERCHNEVKHKLADWGIYGQEADEVLSRLIEQNYLNEERFACTFAGGKFRVKQWGRLKIKRELKVRGVSEYCITKAMKEINEEEYLQTLRFLAEGKMKSLQGKHPLEKKQKTYHFLATKGYEGDQIMNVISEWLK